MQDKRLSSLVYTISLAIALLCFSGTSNGQDKGKAFIQRFLDALAERRDDIHGARFELTGKQLIAAKSYSGVQEMENTYFPEADVNGDLKLTTILDFSGNRFRNDLWNMIMFQSEAKSSAEHVRRITTYDNKKIYTRYPKGPENEVYYRYNPLMPEISEIEKSPHQMMAVFFDEYYPMLIASGRFPLPSSNYSIESRPEYRVSDFQFRGEALAGGVKCAVIRWVRPPHSEFIKEYSSGILVYELTTNYVADSPIPRDWTYKVFKTDNPKRKNGLSKQLKFTVTSSEFNRDEIDSIYRPDFVPEMLVLTKGEVYRVGADGETLEPLEGHSRRRWYIALSTIGGIFLIFFAYYRYRLRKVT